MNVYEIITGRIIERLEQGEIPWKKSWNARTQAPRNLISGKLYSGINVFILLSAHYQSPYWLTFKQAKERGGTVRKGEKGLPIVFWSKTEKEDQETGEVKEVGFLRYYTVFNVSQIDGLQDVPETITRQNGEAAEAEDLRTAALIVAGYKNAPQILHGFTRACYVPASDQVKMPDSTAFTSMEDYYGILFHELVHSTGHTSRLARVGITESDGFGGEEYSKEELIAEMGSAFLSAEANISPAVIDNQAAYVQGWIKVLKGDSRLLVCAAANAQKAVDFICNRPVVSV